MKKWILCLVLVLVGCGNGPKEAILKAPEPEPEPEIEIMEMEEPIESVDLKNLIIKSNRRMMVIEVETLHERMEAQLLAVYDDSKDMALQEEIISEIVYGVVLKWRIEQVEVLLDEENIELNDQDYHKLIEKTSLTDMYELMLSYELIFLKNYD